MVLVPTLSLFMLQVLRQVMGVMNPTRVCRSDWQMPRMHRLQQMLSARQQTSSRST